MISESLHTNKQTDILEQNDKQLKGKFEANKDKSHEKDSQSEETQSPNQKPVT